MFKRIVVGIDGSTRDAEAVALALRLRAPDGQLSLVCAHPASDPLTRMGGDFGYQAYLEADAQKALDRAAKRIPDEVAVQTHIVADDSPAAALDGLALATRADLVVLGGSHHGRFGRLTGRTTAQRMLAGAPCAVAVATAGHPEGSAIAVAVDDSPEAAVALGTAYAIARGLGLGVRLCRAVEPLAYVPGFAPSGEIAILDEDRLAVARAEVDELASQAPPGIVVEPKVACGPARETILTQAGTDCLLLVTGSRHYGPVHRVLVGSVSAGLLTDGRVPVLVTPRGAAVPAVAR